MMTTFEDDARAALAAKGVAERRLAQAAVCPPWRHAAFAAVMATLVISPLVAMPLRLGILVGALLAVALVVQSDRRRTGMFINGYRRGRTLLVTLPLLAANLGLYLLSIHASERGEMTTVVLLAGAAFLVSLAGSLVWQRVFVRELGA
jgi:hypothetical protein